MPPLPNSQVNRSLVLSKREKRNKQRGEKCKSPKKTRPNVRRLAFFFLLQSFDRNVEF